MTRDEYVEQAKREYEDRISAAYEALMSLDYLLDHALNAMVTKNALQAKELADQIEALLEQEL